MYAKELKRTKKKIERLYRKGIFNGRSIYLFGVSENTRQVIQMFREREVYPAGVIDNDRLKQGNYCSRLKVWPFETVVGRDKEDHLYVIYSGYWREMAAQLIKNGVSKDKLIVLYHEGSFAAYILSACRGKLLYNRFRKKYGAIPFFLCPYTGTGDIYLIGSFWRQFCNKNNIEDYVFCVISKACEKVTRLFDIKNVTVLTDIESGNIISAHMFFPDEVDIKLLNDSWAQIHTNQIEWFRGYKGLEFTELFKRYVFDLPKEAEPEKPVYKDVSREIASIFQEQELPQGKTVILSPYSNTLADLPEDFWNEIAARLSGLGYVACTNIGRSTEKPIAGTKALFFDLHIAPQIIEAAGYFIGVRSGFCDVISGARAKKAILYDRTDRFYMGSAFEYFNLKDMGLCDDALEIEYSGEELDKAISDIINFVEENEDKNNKALLEPRFGGRCK